MVEIFFGIITRQAIRRGTFTSVKDLIAAIETFIDGWNERCQPFTWTKTADQILPHATGSQRSSIARHQVFRNPRTSSVSRVYVTTKPPPAFRHMASFINPGEVPMSKLAVRSVAAAFATALVLSTAAPAFANPPPPTNGGNGAGSERTVHRQPGRPSGVLSLAAGGNMKRTLTAVAFAAALSLGTVSRSRVRRPASARSGQRRRQLRAVHRPTGGPSQLLPVARWTRRLSPV